MNNLPDEQRAAIAVVRARPDDWGTGFVVGPGLMLTAYHVVGDRNAATPTFFDGPRSLEFKRGVGKGVIDGFDVVAGNPGADWALLRFDDPVGLPALELSAVGPNDVEWYGFGFPKQQNVDGQLLSGTIKDVGAELRGESAMQVYCEELAARGLAGGASGSPILVNGRVVGLLRFTLSDEAGVSRGTLYACPATAVDGHEGLSVAEVEDISIGGLTAERLKELKAACCQVRLPESIVSGYLVAPDLVVTWSTSVPALPDGTLVEVVLGGAERRATLVGFDAEGECALLRLAEPISDIQPLELASCDSPNVTWISLGFPPSAGVYGVETYGVVRHAILEPPGGGEGVLALHSSEFSSDPSKTPFAGMEGAPVIVDGAVVGHLLRPVPFQLAHAAPSRRVKALLETDQGVSAPSELSTVGHAEAYETSLSLPELEPGEHHVALCYRGTDRAWVNGLAGRLEGAGFRILFDGYEVGDSPDVVEDRMSRLGSARSIVIVMSPAWVDSKIGALVEKHVLEIQRSSPDVRVVPALIDDAVPAAEWRDRPGIRFDGSPCGRSLERLEHALLGASTPRPWSAAAASLRAATRPADDLIRMVDEAEATPEQDESLADQDVRAAEAGGVLRVTELWDVWLSAGVDDVSAPLAVAESLIRLGHPRRSLDVLAHAGGGTRARQLEALALGDLSEKLDDSIHILEQLRAEGQQDIETVSILAGRLKQRWRITGNRNDLQAAHKLYAEAFRRTQDTYPGINAAATALYSGNRQGAVDMATEVRDRLVPKLEEGLDDWGLASLAEAFLILGDEEAAREHYGTVVSNRPNATRELVTIRRQIRIDLDALGRPRDALDDLFFIPRPAAFTGHLTDAPDRAEARFPMEAIPGVKKRIKDLLRTHDIGVGYCSAARGSDLIFIREMVTRNAEVNVILPFAKESFLSTSVGDEWASEFEELLEREGVEVTVLSEEVPQDEAGLAEAFSACNREIMNRVIARAESFDEEPLLLYVWNGAPGDGKGGTSDFVNSWRMQGLPEEHIEVAAG